MTSAPVRGLATIEDARENLRSKPVSASISGRTWQGVAIDEVSSYAVRNMAVEPRDHHLLCINLADHSYVRSERCGRVHQSAGLAGEAAIIPAGVASTWDGSVPSHLTLRVPPNTLTEMAEDVRRYGSQRTNIANHFRIRDPFVASMATIFHVELSRASHPAQDVLLGSLITALSMHLLRDYTNAPQREERQVLNVGSAPLRRALAYIEDQPYVRISLEDLSEVAGLSRFHFGRLFRRQFGISPASYVERSRLERAKVMIRHDQMALAEIAHALGFSDQSHFTRRFRRHEGCTPSEYRQDHRWRPPSGPMKVK